MNFYGQRQAFYNDLIYPISPMYSTDLVELLDRENEGCDVIYSPCFSSQVRTMLRAFSTA